MDDEQLDKSYFVTSFRRSGWRLPDRAEPCRIDVQLRPRDDSDDPSLLSPAPTYEADPIGYLLASGTRAVNLDTYLEGCEVSGAEHLRHPYLIHLFAQQTTYNMVRHGVLYAELRASIIGYENSGLTFNVRDACLCMTEAFRTAQEEIASSYSGQHTEEGVQPVRVVLERDRAEPAALPMHDLPGLLGGEIHPSADR